MAKRWKPELEWMYMPFDENFSSKKESLWYQVYKTLKDHILQFTIPPGSRLYEHKIAEDLGVSQTTVRSALLLLELDGLVFRKQGEPAVTIKPSNTGIRNLYQFQYILTKAAAVQAAGTISKEEKEQLFLLAEKADEISGTIGKRALESAHDGLRFHQYFIDLAHNPFFSAAEMQIQSQLQFYTMQLYHSQEFRACFIPNSERHRELCEVYERGRESGNLRLFDATLRHHMFRNLILDWGESETESKLGNRIFNILFQTPPQEEQGHGTISFQKEYLYLRKQNPFISIQSSVSILILRALMDGRLQTTMELNIARIASDLDVSRNPVRDAIKHLVAAGYLCKENEKIYPAPKTDVLAKNIFACRLLVEPYSGILAVEHGTPKDLARIEKRLHSSECAYEGKNVEQFIREDGLFHLSIVYATHNPYLIQMYKSVLILSRMSVFAAAKQFHWTAEDLRGRVEEHRAIFSDLKMRRKDHALRSGRAHILNASNCHAVLIELQPYLEKMDFLGSI